MVDFINEVEEELRKDDYNKLLKRYGPLIAAIIAAVVLGTAFLEWREYADDKSARATSASYVEAERLAGNGDVNAAEQAYLRLAAEAPQGYAGLSLMRAAILKLEAGDRAGAVKLYDQAAQAFEAPRHKQLAQLKAAYILAGNGAYQDVLTRTMPLAELDMPYEFLARELVGFAAEQSGNSSLAREQFGYLENIPGVPATIKERANQSLSLMQAKTAMQAPQPVKAEMTEVETDDSVIAEQEDGSDNE